MTWPLGKSSSRSMSSERWVRRRGGAGGVMEEGEDGEGGFR